MDINSQILEKMKQKALLYYKENKKIISPLFWEIRITNSWFNHIEWKNKVHKRDFKEAYVRNICFFHTVPAWKKDWYLWNKDNILFFDEKLE